MQELLTVGRTLYHKYLSNITIVEVFESGIKADTGSRGVLEFALYDLGKVLYFEKSHSDRTFESYIEYLGFSEEEKRKNIALGRDKNEPEKMQKSIIEAQIDYIDCDLPPVFAYKEC